MHVACDACSKIVGGQACHKPIRRSAGHVYVPAFPAVSARAVREALRALRHGLQAPAQQAAALGGLPPTVPATQVNKVCSSGLKAVSLAAQSILLGELAAGREPGPPGRGAAVNG